MNGMRGCFAGDLLVPQLLFSAIISPSYWLDIIYICEACTGSAQTIFMPRTQKERYMLCCTHASFWCPCPCGSLSCLSVLFPLVSVSFMYPAASGRWGYCQAGHVTDGPELSLGAGYGLNQRFRQHVVEVVAHSNNLASVAECRHLFTIYIG
jgi:hypothetical protein